MRRRVDLALPAHAPIAEYVSGLSRMCGQETDETFPAAWSLAPAGARPFPVTMSLLEAQVVDGATLYLRDVLEGETDGPVVTDIEEIVEETAGQWDRWNRRHRAMTAIGIGLGGLLAALAVLVLDRPDAPLTGLVAIVVGFGLATLAGIATRRGHALPVPLRIAMALSACPALALAGYALPVGGDGAGATAVAVTAGAAAGAVAAALALPHEATLITGLLAAVALPVAVLLAAVDADLVESAAVTAVVALMSLSAAPTAAGRLVAFVPARTNAGAPPDPAAEIADTVGRGRRVLITLAVVSSLVSAASLLVLAASDDPFAVTLALCVSLALLAQSGQSIVPVAVVPGIAAGAAGLLALTIQAPVRLLHATAAASVLVTCGLAAIVLAIGFALATRPVDASGERPAWLDTAGLLLAVASVPLAVGVFGVFGHLADVGGRL